MEAEAVTDVASESNPQMTRREILTAAALLGLVLAVARFSHCARMGFYEDDYSLVTQAMASSWPEVRDFVWSLLSSFGGQGRPLQHGLLFVLSWVSGRLGGLPMAYALGWVILWLNSVLAYLLFRRLAALAFAVPAVLAFALFGADTTQAFIYHSLGLQQSLTFLLLACLLYLSRARPLSYLLILGSLLSYETAYPVFLAAPLLGRATGRRLLRELIYHGLLMAVLFAGVLGVRMLAGESRLASLGFPAIVTVPLQHTLQGPVVSLGTFAYRPLQAILALDVEMAAVLVGFSLGFVLVLRRVPLPPALATADVWASIRGRSLRLLPVEAQGILRLGLSGVAMLALAYPLTFTIRAYAISGRDTRVHFAAVLGAALLYGCAVWLAAALTRGRRVQGLLHALVALHLAFMAGFALVVQRSYVRSWQLQRGFWNEVIRLCPDLTDGTVILVQPDGLEDTRFIDANTWSLPRILDQILTFPADFERPPRVYRLLPDWREYLLGAAGEVRLNATTVTAPRSSYTSAAVQDVILLHPTTGGLERVQGAVEVQGGSIVLRAPPASPSGAREEGFLYPYLIQ
jgi:hypothetical protein